LDASILAGRCGEGIELQPLLHASDQNGQTAIRAPKVATAFLYQLVRIRPKRWDETKLLVPDVALTGTEEKQQHMALVLWDTSSLFILSFSSIQL
jgi:hypothetical protein